MLGSIVGSSLSFLEFLSALKWRRELLRKALIGHGFSRCCLVDRLAGSLEEALPGKCHANGAKDLLVAALRECDTQFGQDYLGLLELSHGEHLKARIGDKDKEALVAWGQTGIF